jgi:predicted DNA-binding protein with PD1-like motif
MTGNVTIVEGKPFIHVHAVLSSSDEGLSCVGGHIKECEVAVTLEIFLTTIGTAIERKMDDTIGLKAMSL